jgi:hypothetical protein
MEENFVEASSRRSDFFAAVAAHMEEQRPLLVLAA